MIVDSVLENVHIVVNYCYIDANEKCLNSMKPEHTIELQMRVTFNDR
jgi:hypothetical protein